MDALEQLHIIIDESNWDDTNKDLIDKAFQEANIELIKEKDEKILHLFEIERQVFTFNKSPERKLSFKFVGENIFEDGNKIPFEWPDIRTFSKEDFIYLLNRFNESNNTFAQSEYGLVSYYAGQLKRNDDVLLLLQKLFELAKNYIAEAKNDSHPNHYIFYFSSVLANALHIAENRKTDPSIGKLYKKLIQFTFKVHQKWNVAHEASLRTAIDLTNFTIQYLSDFKDVVDITALITKNWKVVNYQTKTNVGGAIQIADISIRLCRKLSINQSDWLLYKAKQYEKLAEESKKQNNMAALDFVGKAMNIYKDLKVQPNLSRLQNAYQQLRSDFHLSKVSTKMPQEETQRIIQHIQKIVHESNEEEIVKELMLTPMIIPLADIRKWSEDSLKENLLQNLFPVSILDNFGNTIATYSTEEERKKFAVLRTYEIHFQIAVQTLLQLFIEAFRAKKISSNSVISLLKQTWLNQNNIRKLDGRERKISYLPLIESGVNLLFHELHQWNTVQGYLPNLVSATDSLVLKAEYLLREFARNSGLHTFKPKVREPTLIMEKNLDDLLNDLSEKLTEDDHFFIKFILAEKAGYNLRNRIAHGLIDNVEYGLEYTVLALVIILKLSNYQFIQEQNN